MAISTYQTYLMYAESGDTLAKLVDVTEMPDIGEDPEMLETTTLSDEQQTFITGIHGMSAMVFQANYDKTDFAKLKALEGKTIKLGVYFGADSSGNPDGSQGKWTFDGQISVRASGGGVNEVHGMSISIAPSTVIEFE